MSNTLVWTPDLAELEQIRRSASETVKTTAVFSFAESSCRYSGTIAVKPENLQSGDSARRLRKR
jgi:hypothetical protein